MSGTFDSSPLSTTVEVDGNPTKLYRVEAMDLARALCGALFLALPLHFTMEMWALARTIPDISLIVVVVTAYLLNVGYHYFSGFNTDGVPKQQPWFDALSSLGIGLFASCVTMLLIDQFSQQMPFEVLLKVGVIEMVPTSFGASLAKSQLGGGNNQQEEDLTSPWSADKKKLLGALLGSTMFAFNIAATQEPVLIATSIQPLQLIGIVIFSLLVSYLMIFFAAFKDRGPDQSNGIMGEQWAETTICYCIALFVSAALLWMFGYMPLDTPVSLWLPWVIVLGYATTLGGSAGRLII